MGTSYSFKCTRCGYSATLSGGDDQGMVVRTTTIVCRTCIELYDVVTGELEDGFMKIPIRCPKVKKHIVEKWEDPGACPKCGGIMENQGSCIDWD